jgi:Protein of unknown function (DUF3891)
VLVRKQERGALVIGQLSHAWLSGQLARAWGNEEFPAPEPREEIALGAEQHDLGWALFDLHPALSADSGLPRSFLEVTPEEHLEIWRTAPDRLLSASAHAALVVSLHGASLSELRLGRGRTDHPGLLEHVAQEHERQVRLRAMLGLSEERTDLIQHQMWTWDGLSLALCLGWDPFTTRDVPGRDGPADLELRTDRAEGSFTLDPWPFSVSRLEVGCEGRRLAPRYEDQAAMRRALAAAEPVPLRFTLLPRGQ